MAPANEQLCAALKQGDRSAPDALVEQNTAFLRRTAYNLANQFKRPQATDDLAQEGAMALMEAAERYDPERGTLFLTYAGTRVLKAMRSYLEFIIAAECVSPGEIAEAGEAALMVLNEINYIGIISLNRRMPASANTGVPCSRLAWAAEQSGQKDRATHDP